MKRIEAAAIEAADVHLEEVMDPKLKGRVPWQEHHDSFTDGYEEGFRAARELINQKLIHKDDFDWESAFILSIGEEEV